MRVALGVLTLLLLPLLCLAAVTACPQPPVAGATAAQEAGLDAIFNKVVVQSAGCTTAAGPDGPANRLEFAFPALASIMVIATFSLWFLAGLSFFLDRYRFSVVVFTSLLIFSLNLADQQVASITMPSDR
jgi:hypothetical protein